MAIICSRQRQQTTFSDAFFLGTLRVNTVSFDCSVVHFHLFICEDSHEMSHCMTKLGKMHINLLVPSRHMTSKQRHIDIDVTSGRHINVNMTLF